jgi:hypothetical protein
MRPRGTLLIISGGKMRVDAIRIGRVALDKSSALNCSRFSTQPSCCQSWNERDDFRADDLRADDRLAGRNHVPVVGQLEAREPGADSHAQRVAQRREVRTVGCKSRSAVSAMFRLLV